MESILSAAVQGARKLYNTFKDYEGANEEAKDLAERLYMLNRTLQDVPAGNESVREPLTRVKETVEASYTILLQRLQTDTGIWRTLKDLASSASDRQKFTEIAWELRSVLSDLHIALSANTNAEVRNIRQLLENPDNTSSVTVRTVKQLRARVDAPYVNEPVDSTVSSPTTNDTTDRNAASMSPSNRSMMIAKYSWSDLIWEDGVGPTPENPRSCLIRKGGFGSVYKAVLRGVGEVALKHLDIDPAELRGRRFKEFKRECILLQRVSTHPNVVSFYGMVKEANSVGLVTDLAKGDSLFAAINEENHDYWLQLPTLLKLKALSGLIAAVNYMHSTGVIHGDLKPQNVLLAAEMSNSSSPPTLWVSDFGLSRTTHTVKTSQGSVISSLDGGSRGGTLGFQGPETLEGYPISKRSDIFSLAITIWSALSCEEPFQGVSDPSAYMYQVRTANVRPDLNSLPRDVPRGIISLLHKAWDTIPENRPSIEEFLNQWEGEVITAKVSAHAKTVDPLKEKVGTGIEFVSDFDTEANTLELGTNVGPEEHNRRCPPKLTTMRRIVVASCFIFVIVAIGVPKWGKCHYKSNTVGHFGLFQGEWEGKSCALEFNNYAYYFDLGRILAMLSPIPLLGLLKKFQTFGGAALATSFVAVYFSVVTIYMSTFMRHRYAAEAVFGNCVGTGGCNEACTRARCSPDSSLFLYATVLGCLYAMLLVPCGWYVYKRRRAAEVDDGGSEDELLPDEPKNFPVCYPLVRLHINNDVPFANRKVVKLALVEFLLCIASMLVNTITELIVVGYGFRSGSEVGISIVYLLSIFAVGWLWFKQLYIGMSRDKPFNFICFFILFSLTLGFLLLCLLGFWTSGMISIYSFLLLLYPFRREWMRPEGLAGQLGLGAMIITTLLMYAVGIGMGCFIIWKVFKAYKDRVNAGTWRHAPITVTDGEAPLRVGLLESGIRRG